MRLSETDYGRVETLEHLIDYLSARCGTRSTTG
jgi:hypothetical protein